VQKISEFTSLNAAAGAVSKPVHSFDKELLPLLMQLFKVAGRSNTTSRVPCTTNLTEALPSFSQYACSQPAAAAHNDGARDERNESYLLSAGRLHVKLINGFMRASCTILHAGSNSFCAALPEACLMAEVIHAD
jgi:hypothetical protein